LYSIAKIIPEKIFRKILRKIINIAFNLLKKEKKIAYKNLEVINPSLNKEEKDKIYRKFTNVFSEILSDQILFSKYDKEDLISKIEVIGYERIKEYFNYKKGIILVVGHLGNWEIFGVHACLNGFPINCLYRPLDNKLLDKYLNKSRTMYGVKLISKFSSPLNMIRPLMNNEALVFLADQNTIKNYLYVPFFGKIASASRGFSFFHLKTNAPVVFAYSYIDDDLKQYGIFEECFDFVNLYNKLSIKEKHFLNYFNLTFNSRSSKEIYQENLNNFKKFYSIEDRFKLNEQELAENELEKFKDKIKNYNELSFDEKSFYITYFFHQALEKVIFKYPESWLLVHPRFNKQPEGFPKFYNFKK